MTFTLIPAASTSTPSVQVLGFGDIGRLTRCGRLICGSCSSGQCFACGFLQIPPRGGHPCRSASGSPCRAHRGLAPQSHPASTTCTGTAPVKALRAMPGAPNKKRAPCGSPRQNTDVNQWILLPLDMLVLTRILGGQADHYDGNEGGNETRDDFIYARATHEAAVPAQGDPDHYRGSTHDHTGNGTGAVGAGPHQGQQDQRAEGGTEACPGVTDQGQNLGVRVRGDDRSYQTNGYNAGTADVYALFVGRFFAQEQAIEILCQ